MAQRTIGAILNEAADANERGMESSRRSALTNLQIKGEVADQNFQEEQRGRDREFFGGMKAAAQKHLFKDETVPGSSAITGAPGEVIQPAQTRRIPVDLSTSDGLKAISAFQQEVFQLRASQGRITGEEMGQLLSFRKTLDQAGATEEFRSALGGDPTAIASLSKRLGVGGAVKIMSGFDDVGMPQIYALTRSDGPGGKLVEQKVPVGHLLAAISPDVDGMLKSQREGVKFGDDMRNSASTRIYQDRSGRALLENAKTNASKAARNTAAFQQYTVFKDAQKAEDFVVPGFSSGLPGEQPEPIEDTTGRRLVDRLGRIFIEESELMGGSAHNLAVSTLGEANAEASREFNKYRAEIQNAYRIATGGKPVRLSNGAVVNPNDDTAMKNLKDEFFALEDSASAAGLWQQGRDQIMEAKIAELTGSQKAAIKK
jgi:hypothetical protein